MTVLATHFRRDVQALRTVAVLSVLAFHLWPGAVPGGFVGVDVFFVISGFLIMGNLLRESAHGSLQLADFWSKRARRLLPASFVVLTTVAICTFLFVPEHLWKQYFRELIASALYVQNWRLAVDAVDYQASSNLASPVQHFWSLSIEEQFYVVVPTVLFVITALVRLPRHRRTVMALALTAMTLSSAVWSVTFTAQNASSAYFVTTTRAWEFGVGALLAFVPLPRAGRWCSWVFAGGVVAMLAAAVVIDEGWPFPGLTALWPVAATAAALFTGNALQGRSLRAVSARPVQFIGRISYAVYLWHWPMIVLLPFISGHPLTSLERVLILVASLTVGWLSTAFIEEPIRSSPRLRNRLRPRTVLAFTVASMLVLVATGTAGTRLSQHETATDLRGATDSIAAHPECFGAVVVLEPAGCDFDVTQVVPAPAGAAEDYYVLDRCWTGRLGTGVSACNVGAAAPTLRLLAVGDSHNNALLAAYELVGRARGWQFTVTGKNGCYWTDARLDKKVDALTAACERWQRSLTEWLDQQPPFDAIIVTSSRGGDQPFTEPGQDPWDAAADGLARAWSAQLDRGVPVIAIRDVPRLHADVVTCVSADPRTANDRCSSSTAEAMGERDPIVEAGRRTGSPVVDLTDVYCSASVCVPVIGHVMAYRNADHLTATFVRTLAPTLGERLETALAAVGRPRSGTR